MRLTMGILVVSGVTTAAALGAGPARQVPVPDATLVGWAMLPVDTLADGPTSGQFAGAGQFGRSLPLPGKQPVQGFSGVIAGPASGTYYVVQDNGFGAKANSADALLHVYAVRPEFRTSRGGSGTVGAADFRTGRPLPSFLPDSFITLRDPERRAGFPIVAERETYPGAPAGIAVDASIRSGRLLTGADFDPESIRRDRQGNFWFGDEFGPFLLKTDAAGTLLRAEIPLEGVFSPDHPQLGGRTPTLGRSRGFEGLALGTDGATLFALVEGTVTGDPPNTLRMHEFDLTSERYTGRSFLYPLSDEATNIGDMTALDAHRFLVLERNEVSGASGPRAPVKRVFVADIQGVASGRAVSKTLVADLMHIADPDDLNRDGLTTFTFPFITIEDILVVDTETVLIVNDNNYPGGGGRGAVSDNTEFILVRLGLTARSSPGVGLPPP